MSNKPKWAIPGETYVCRKPRGCGYAFVKTEKGWQGPIFPDGDQSCRRDLSHEELKDGYADCWHRIKTDRIPMIHGVTTPPPERSAGR